MSRQTGGLRSTAKIYRITTRILLRRKIGLVLQKNHIFRGSIEENIRYGNMNATFEEIVGAAKKAYLQTKSKDFPTNIIPTRSRFRRTTAAHRHRAFILKRPADYLSRRTDGEFGRDCHRTNQKQSRRDQRNRTTVVISHSISQIIDSDIIFVLREGRVVESGTHEQLYEMDGTYHKIFNASARSLNLDRISRTLETETL